MIRDWIRRQSARSSYPQVVFGREIARMLRRTPGQGACQIVDIPCGEGAVSGVLARMPGARVLGLDLAAERVERARALFGEPGVQYECGNIYEYLASAREIDVLCVVNSLFCLPDARQVMDLARGAIGDRGVMYVVIPNVRASNYKSFTRDHPEMNQTEFCPSEALGFFRQSGFEVRHSRGVAWARWYGRPLLKQLRSLAPFYLRIENWVLSVLARGEPGYFLFELVKQADDNGGD